jgi:predicted ATPase
MSKIRISNFGPIKAGYQENDGWLDVKKVTVFIGNQGSGKSTVAKLISTMTWIEKALVRGDFKEKDLTVYNRFAKHCSYQNIQSYFKENTRIEYKGKAFSILYEFGNVTVRKNQDNGYSFPKIMYVPSERNFVSSVKNVRNLKGLPSTLYTFSDEFIDAIEDLKSHIDLPINNARFEYQKLNKLSWIIGDDYKIKLSEASSGFQSFVPLFIVTNYLSHSLEKETDSSVKEISIEEGKRIREEIEKIYSNPNLSEEIKKASLEYLSSRFKYSCFINIVEEPEQNLFPSSQRHILNKLLEFANMNKENVLVMTTHSPYVINYLTLCIKAESVYKKLGENQFQPGNPEYAKTNEIVPFTSTVNSNEFVIYELDENDGSIIKLPDYKGLPSDENKLNINLEDSNELFAQLQEIEKGWR